MSSSSEDETEIAVKRVKRRHQHRITSSDADRQKVNLYSHKILPKLDALAKSPIKISKEDEDEGNDYFPFDITPARKSPEPENLPENLSPNVVESPQRSGLDLSQVIPPTPPPPFKPRREGKHGRKAKKLLKEVSTVLSQVSELDSTHDSVVIVDEPIDLVKEVVVKIRLRGKLNKFPVEERHSLEEVFHKLSKKAKVDDSRLLITFGDRRVFPSDTPAGLQISIADILECTIAHRRLAPDIQNTIKIQMQGPFQKKKESFTMGGNEPFQAVMVEYAGKNNTSFQNLQFRFDGEALKPTTTPKSLDMENGDCIDVIHSVKR